MKADTKKVLKHILLFSLQVGMIVLTYLYFSYLKDLLHYSFLISGQAVLFISWVLFFHLWYMAPYNKVRGTVDEYSNVIIAKDELMKQLQHKNELLESSNKLTKTIMSITNDILFAEDLDLIIQNILESAIQIIPHAQKGSILMYNGEYLEFKAMYGYNYEVLKGVKFDITECFQYKSNNFYDPIIIQDVEEFNRNLNREKFEALKNSRSFELKAVISCAIRVDNEFLGIINIDNVDYINAFTEQDRPLIKHLADQMGLALKNAKLIEKTLYLSRHDSLTGIYNRSYFEELLEKHYINARRATECFTLVAFDINYLKNTNDNYGHEAGDKLIKSFVYLINSHPDRPNIFARTGGDEFSAVFFNKDYQSTADIISSYCSSFKGAPFVFEEKELFEITFGYGISSYPMDSESKEDLLRIADKKMYDNKKISKLC